MIRVQGRTRHFKILALGQNRFAFGGGDFESIRELIDHYTREVPIFEGTYLAEGMLPVNELVRGQVYVRVWSVTDVTGLKKT